jgi:hypothetical protein
MKICGIKLSERLKAVIEPKLGITFQSKETVIELNGGLIEVLWELLVCLSPSKHASFVKCTKQII